MVLTTSTKYISGTLCKLLPCLNIPYKSGVGIRTQCSVFACAIFALSWKHQLFKDEASLSSKSHQRPVSSGVPDGEIQRSTPRRAFSCCPAALMKMHTSHNPATAVARAFLSPSDYPAVGGAPERKGSGTTDKISRTNCRDVRGWNTHRRNACPRTWSDTRLPVMRTMVMISVMGAQSQLGCWLWSWRLFRVVIRPGRITATGY